MSTKLVIVTKYTSSAEIVCIAQNLPYSDMSIYFQGKQIPPEEVIVNTYDDKVSLKYLITYSGSKQTGKYTCKAENIYGDDAFELLVFQLGFFTLKIFIINNRCSSSSYSSSS